MNGELCSKCKKEVSLSYHRYCYTCLRIMSGRAVTPKFHRDPENNLCSKCKKNPRQPNHNYCRECQRTICNEWYHSHKVLSPPLSVEERIERRSEKQPNGCVHWTGRTHEGYGIIFIEKKTRRVTRVIWEIHNGKIPDRMVVRHKCDNPTCINLDHLEIGSKADNNRDRQQRGRNGDRSFEKNGRAKLTWNLVLQIRAERPRNAGHAWPITYRELAKKYRMSGSQIVAIVQGWQWDEKERVD